MKLSTLVAATALAVSVALPAAAGAQLVRGTVIDRENRAPLRGVFVVLLDPAGRQRVAVLTDEKGEFVIRAPAAGTWSLRADRIGHRTATVAAFALEPNQTRTFDIAADVLPMQLARISVSAERRCEARPESGTETARVWTEAKKALTVAAWVQGSAALFRVRHYERELSAELLQLGTPRFRFSNSAGKLAFRAASADSLSRYGFVQQSGADDFFFGPDADVLLSDAFLDQHCFRVERKRDRVGLIGLSFEPIRTRTLPDIRGTLWLNERTGKLSFIEYAFTRLQVEVDPQLAGGRTEFEQLPNGAWIVRNWHIRMPRLARAGGAGAAARVIGVREEGGQVLDAKLAGEATVTLVPRYAVRGIVFDSTLGRPLENATVYLSGTPFSTISGNGGRFALDSIPTGEYTIAFSHAKLDSLPSWPSPQLIKVDSALARVDLGIPAFERVLGSVCTPELIMKTARLTGDTVRVSRGVMFGVVSSQTGPVQRADVQAEWQRFESKLGLDVVISIQKLRMRPITLLASTNPEGRYNMCGLPIDHPLTLTLLVNDRAVASDSARVNPGGILRRDWRVGRNR